MTRTDVLINGAQSIRYYFGEKKQSVTAQHTQKLVMGRLWSSKRILKCYIGDYP